MVFNVENGSNNEDEEDESYDWEMVSFLVPFLHHYRRTEINREDLIVDGDGGGRPAVEVGWWWWWYGCIG